MSKNRGFAKVTVRGEEKIMRFDFNAIADLEEYYGKGFAAIMAEEAVGFSTVRALYWAGLKWTMKGLTIAQAGVICKELIEDGAEITELFKAPMTALKNSGLMGSKKAQEETDELAGVIGNDEDEEDPEKN